MSDNPKPDSELQHAINVDGYIITLKWETDPGSPTPTGVSLDAVCCTVTDNLAWYEPDDENVPNVVTLRAHAIANGLLEDARQKALGIQTSTPSVTST